MDEAIERREALAELADSINAALNDLAEWFKTTIVPILEKVAEVCLTLYKAMWTSYRSAGAPYGDNDDGFFAWWREKLWQAEADRQVEIARARGETFEWATEMATRYRAKLNQVH